MIVVTIPAQVLTAERTLEQEAILLFEPVTGSGRMPSSFT